MTGATNRLPGRRFRGLFLADVAEMALISTIQHSRGDAAALRALEKSPSEDQRENPAGTRHVRAITVAESFQHHPLFPGNTAKK